MKKVLRRLSVIVALTLSPFAAAAHEVTPAVADLTITDGRATLAVTATLEALAAGVDLDGLANTNESANSAEYDRLRGLAPPLFEEAFRAAWPEIRERIHFETAEGRIAPDLVALEIPPIGDPETPRLSVLTIAAAATGPVRVGWDRAYGDLVLRQQGLDPETAFTGLLSGGELSPPISAAGAASEGGWATFARYIGVGFDHIVPKGLDHILFVLGLFFLTPRLVPLLWQVSAFTLAHSVTLAFGALGWVVVDPGIVEPLIALSIVYVAVENLTSDGRLSRWRPLLIFGFGLLHGLGFASVLGEFGLPESQFIPALVGFNVGVEVGQLAVIAAAFLAVGLWFRGRDWYRPWISAPASVAIAAVGAYWVVERTLL